MLHNVITEGDAHDEEVSCVTMISTGLNKQTPLIVKLNLHFVQNVQGLPHHDSSDLI